MAGSASGSVIEIDEDCEDEVHVLDNDGPVPLATTTRSSLIWNYFTIKDRTKKD